MQFADEYLLVRLPIDAGDRLMVTFSLACYNSKVKSHRYICLGFPVPVFTFEDYNFA